MGTLEGINQKGKNNYQKNYSVTIPQNELSVFPESAQWMKIELYQDPLL